MKRAAGTIQGLVRVILLALSGAISGLAAEGMYVFAGEPRPEPDFLLVTAGRPARVDLLLSAPLPAANQCRTTLYALGGPLAARLGDQTAPLVVVADGRNSYRASLSITIPAARPGTRFLLKTECLAPTPQILGTVELRVPDNGPLLDEIRTGLSGRPVQVAGPSHDLRELLTGGQITFTDRAEPVPGAVVLAEQPVDLAAESALAPAVLVVFQGSSSSVLTLAAQKAGDGWQIDATLPAAHQLAGPAAFIDLAQVVRFIHQLENPH